MKKLVAFSAPILPGQTEQWKKFISEIQGARKKDFSESRKKFDVHERTFLQQTPHGDVVIVTLEGEDPVGGFIKFAQSENEFTKWFVNEVRKAHGFDLKDMAKMPMPELTLDSEGA